MILTSRYLKGVTGLGEFATDLLGAGEGVRAFSWDGAEPGEVIEARSDPFFVRLPLGAGVLRVVVGAASCGERALTSELLGVDADTYASTDDGVVDGPVSLTLAPICFVTSVSLDGQSRR